MKNKDKTILSRGDSVSMLSQSDSKRGMKNNKKYMLIMEPVLHSSLKSKLASEGISIASFLRRAARDYLKQPYQIPKDDISEAKETLYWDR